MVKIKKRTKRSVDLLVLSDIHLGTYGCKAKELNNYLKSIDPKEIILNGDIVDIWQFKKRYWPNSHMKIISKLFKWVSKGVKVTYVTGNHDEMLRKFEGFQIGSFEIQNKSTLVLDNKKAWFFHGDVFDVTMQHSRWIIKAGAIGYDLLILLNSIVNKVSELLGKGKISLSKKVKNSVKSAVSYINKFEDTATSIAAENGFHYVVCGHIHQPVIKTCQTVHGEVVYLNSGDWIENLTALEYHEGKWSLYVYDEDATLDFIDDNLDQEDEQIEDIDILIEKTNKELFENILQDMLKTSIN
jgi:UDP-2,3-diacylglucosamine pyrophosphatase LpxH